jgi:hypothetical protein
MIISLISKTEWDNDFACRLLPKLLSSFQFDLILFKENMLR